VYSHTAPTSQKQLQQRLAQEAMAHRTEQRTETATTVDGALEAPSRMAPGVGNGFMAQHATNRERRAPPVPKRAPPVPARRRETAPVREEEDTVETELDGPEVAVVRTMPSREAALGQLESDTWDVRTGRPVGASEVSDGVRADQATLERALDALDAAHHALDTYEQRVRKAIAAGNPGRELVEQGAEVLLTHDACLDALGKLIRGPLDLLLDSGEHVSAIDHLYDQVRDDQRERQKALGQLDRFIEDFRKGARGPMVPHSDVETFVEHAMDLEEATADKIYSEVYGATGDKKDHPAMQARTRELIGTDLSTDVMDGWLYLDPKENALLKPENIGCRIYLNVHPAFVPEMSTWLARQLGVNGEVGKDKPTSRLKVAADEDSGKRCDSMVVYVWSADGSAEGAVVERDRLLGVIREGMKDPLNRDQLLRRDAQRDLSGRTGTWADVMMDEIPGMTLQVPDAKGVATAEHPSTDSFGQRCSKAVAGIVAEAKELHLTGVELQQLVKVRLVEAGIDPRKPWEVHPSVPEAFRQKLASRADLFDLRVAPTEREAPRGAASLAPDHVHKVFAHLSEIADAAKAYKP